MKLRVGEWLFCWGVPFILLLTPLWFEPAPLWYVPVETFVFYSETDDFTAYFLSERSWYLFSQSPPQNLTDSRAGVKRSDLTLHCPFANRPPFRCRTE